MYLINQREEAVAAVQRFLLIISQIDNSLPHIIVDGIYNDDTKDAVKIYQKNKNIVPTGIVDYQTFLLMSAEAYDILVINENKNNVFSFEKFPLKLGDSGNDVSNLNTTLRQLSNDYLNIAVLPYGNFFSKETKEAVQTMQKIFKIKEDGIVDYNLMQRLKEETIARNKFKNRIRPI